MTKVHYLLAAASTIVLMGAAAINWEPWPTPPPPPPPVAPTIEKLPQTCRSLTHEMARAIVCEVDLKQHDLALHLNAANGEPYRHLNRLFEEHPFLFAMNAGMYHADFKPVGLHVEANEPVSPVNISDAPGNFFMKPNGVFFVDAEGKAGVLETQAFINANPRVVLATQSGPMLVINGAVHPRFEPNGASRFIRNGVGVRDDGTVVFAISREPVSFGSFARLFRDELKCPNALYFDGTVSALHDDKRYIVGGAYPAGPIIAVMARQTP